MYCFRLQVDGPLTGEGDLDAAGGGGRGAVAYGIVTVLTSNNKSSEIGSGKKNSKSYHCFEIIDWIESECQVIKGFLKLL